MHMRRFTMMMITLLFPTLLFGYFSDFREYGWGHHMGTFGRSGNFMMILIYVIVIYFVFSIVKNLLTRKSGNHESAIQILKERFVRGEITNSEYQEMKQQIKR